MLTCAQGMEQVSKEAGEAATAAKGSYGLGCGEEWMAWLPIAWGIRELIEALEAGGQPAPNSVTERPDGQYVIDAFPLGCAARPFIQAFASHDKVCHCFWRPGRSSACCSSINSWLRCR